MICVCTEVTHRPTVCKRSPHITLGIKRIRIPYNIVLDSYDSLVNAILERYLSDDAKPFSVEDYVIKLRDVGDVSWPYDIESTEDIDLAINTPLAKNEGSIKMSALIHLKSSELPAPVEPAVEPAEAETETRPPAVIDITGSTISSASPSSGEKRKAPAPVTPTKKSPTPKKRKKASKGAAIGGGSKLPVRARIIRSIAELHALGKTNAPRIEVAMFAGYSNAASKGFSNPLSMLKTEGIISYPDKNTVSLTALGLGTDEALGVVPPASNAEVHARIKALLKPKQQEIFGLLADGQAHLRDEMAAAVGCK